MIRLLLAGHGRFATGVLSGIEMIFGPQGDIETVEFVDGETKTELDAKMDTALERLEGAQGVLLLCDVLQGSPFQCAAERALRDERIRVVYGANVPMALEVVARLMGGVDDIDELANAVVEIGREHIGMFDRASASCDDDW
ncbi:PTS sugar transporter subunit IIA [Collinsella stercoris]|uniref:PTS system fructose IIA component n=1 Tax=Collinsella stercoris DSM 13279 TaxID=445975 RepID=B6GED1_9ACTN|nr:PTS fructose transporter subunit IIA [Collinsella stercoris]EEA89351.1 PTS system fructose IIA component [Collinsella stercoris DSM 13279]UEA45724.1 PTS fructose transporter subunit IIA [Collinsella stercoris DSM 13279]UWP11752.1 PTS fructose transporter subunit IIA [Collinsella stercoris]